MLTTAGRGRAGDLARFRRLLLEDASPEELRRAHDLRLARVVRRTHGPGAGRSAVCLSGGGYVGGWLSAWAHRHPEGPRGVVADLGGAARASKPEPEPEPLRHLRDYSDFITPKTGLPSADAWTFATIYVRNLLLNRVGLLHPRTALRRGFARAPGRNPFEGRDPQKLFGWLGERAERGRREAAAGKSGRRRRGEAQGGGEPG